MKSRLEQFMELEAAGGIALGVAVLVALLSANSPLGPLYTRLIDVPLSIQIGGLAIAKPLLLWVNDGLMAIFFALVGMEIKREIREGDSSTPSLAALPAVAALGGMLGPALVYFAFTWGDTDAMRGWAIPTATDIAFALGTLAVLGPRVPASLKVFLLALAIIDDLGAIVIIAVFYTADLSLLALALAGVGLAVLVMLNLAGVARRACYVLVGVSLWVCVLKSGVHATLAGVLVGLAIPLRSEGEELPLRSLEHDLHPWVTFLILPAFAFANAGVRFADFSLSSLFHPVQLGVETGLLLGKPLGVIGAVWIFVRLGLARLPEGTSWQHIVGGRAPHVMNAAVQGGVWIPEELLPLIGGIAGLLFAALFGYAATRQRATAFAMITFGIGELVTAAAVMFNGFFGGEGGVTGNRMMETSLFGLSYAPPIQVYYLSLAWAAVAIVLMRRLTQSPLGRMANACRDNHERAQFVGYNPSTVRFCQFVLSGFFAGIAGALYAMVYEIVTYDSVSTVMSANVLLMTFIGGVGVFWGPIAGAVLFTLLQSWIGLISNAWQIYVGVLFIVMVTYAPGGIAGLVLLHRPIWRAGRIGALLMPYVRVLLPLLVAVAGFIALVELCSVLTVGAQKGQSLRVFGRAFDPSMSTPWAFAALLLAIGGFLTHRAIRTFQAEWIVVSEGLRRE